MRKMQAEAVRYLCFFAPAKRTCAAPGERRSPPSGAVPPFTHKNTADDRVFCAQTFGKACLYTICISRGYFPSETGIITLQQDFPGISGVIPFVFNRPFLFIRPLFRLARLCLCRSDQKPLPRPKMLYGFSLQREYPITKPKKEILSPL